MQLSEDCTLEKTFKSSDWLALLIRGALQPDKKGGILDVSITFKPTKQRRLGREEVFHRRCEKKKKKKKLLSLCKETIMCLPLLQAATAFFSSP